MTYLALTIGPIYKTLKDAKKTRELWGGSYLFSYVMKQIITQFKEREFIVPYIKNKSIFESGNEVGLFHDRFIFEAKEGDHKALLDVVDNVLHALSDGMKIDYDFLKSYLQISVVQKELEEGANPILELSPYLDTAELFLNVAQYSKNPLTKVLKGNNSFLTQDAFEGRKSFPSLPAIALHDMLKESPEIEKLLDYDNEESIYENRDYAFKNYHKYYAIVHADGDSMGKVVERLKGKEAFQNFSKQLFNYCGTSHKIIKDFGGETIFAGGDDLLFFAPVVSGNRTIFELCDEISQGFNKEFKGTDATLSFGVAIQYHKFPLYEALENSRNLLFGDAKSGEKNNIAFCVTKHSGQTFKAVIHKKGELYENFKLFSSNLQGGEDVDNFLHSIHHKIESNKPLLKEIASSKEQLQNFFDNYFNETVHDEYREFFEQLVAFIYESYRVAKEGENPLDKVYATLRFIKFVQGDKA
jgi:CRISPR-associated protein Cmr2